MLVGLDVRVFVEQLGEIGMTALAGMLGVGLVFEVREGLTMHGGLQVLLGLLMQTIVGERGAHDDGATGEGAADEDATNDVHGLSPSVCRLGLEGRRIDGAAA